MNFLKIYLKNDGKNEFASNCTVERQKTKMMLGLLAFSFSPVTFMAVGSYFSKTFAIRFLLIMQRSIVDFPIVDGWKKTNKRWVSYTFWGCCFPWVMRLCDFCWGGFANVEFAKFASWKFSTWPLDLRMHPEKKKINIPIPSILWYIYPTFTIKTVKCK